jgi:hypothetical protein
MSGVVTCQAPEHHPSEAICSILAPYYLFFPLDSIEHKNVLPSC